MVDLLMERRALESVRDVGEAESTSSEGEDSEGEDSCSGVEHDNAVTVGNLEANVVAGMLEETFRQLGQVESAWMQKGCDTQGMLSGVVVFESAGVTLEAQQGFDGVELCGEEMSVRVGVWHWEEVAAMGGSCSGAEEDSGRGGLVEEERAWLQ